MGESSPAEKIVLIAPSAFSRLDLFLTESIAELTRSRAQKLISEGNVHIPGAQTKAKASMPIAPGMRIEVLIPSLPAATALKPEAIPLEILYEDKHVLAINKPAGMVVHPAPGNWTGTLVQALLHHTGTSLGRGNFSIGGELRPGIVHRIDKETSGVLIVAKTDPAFQVLADQFKRHELTRRYLAIAYGKLPKQGIWEGPIGRDPKDRKRMTVIDSGKLAKTRFTSLAYFPGATLFRAELYTGRTHQIRVHAAHAGHPIIGDPLYIRASQLARSSRQKSEQLWRKLDPELTERLRTYTQTEKRQMLHAEFLEIKIPEKPDPIVLSAPPPADFQAVMLDLKKLAG